MTIEPESRGPDPAMSRRFWEIAGSDLAMTKRPPLRESKAGNDSVPGDDGENGQ